MVLLTKWYDLVFSTVNHVALWPVESFNPYVTHYGLKLLKLSPFHLQMLQLLLKASQDKKFVCEEAERTLNTMVASTTPIPLLHKLKVYVSHGNMRVRAKAAVSISHCVSKMVCKITLLWLYLCYQI